MKTPLSSQSFQTLSVRELHKRLGEVIAERANDDKFLDAPILEAFPAPVPAWIEDINAMIDDEAVEVRMRLERGEYHVAAFGLCGEKGKRLASAAGEHLGYLLLELRKRVALHPRTDAKAAKAKAGIK